MPTLKPHSAIPRTVWTLGFVSLFMDLSSELVHSLLPIFLVSTLGANVLTVGVIEGIAEATAHIVKIFSGALTDFFGHRKLLILLGYGLAALSKPLFPLASSVETVFTARFLDRIGKGIRGAPRDALIADVAPVEIRGTCYGLRQSMDTAGAVLGPLLAVLLLYIYNDNIKTALWFAVIPAGITVLLIVAGIKEPQPAIKLRRSRSLNLNYLSSFNRQYWWVVVISAVFTLSRFSEAFLVLRAQQTGLPVTLLPLVMAVMSLIYALSAYPAGILSDRTNQNYLLSAGLVILALADLVLAQANSPTVVMLGVGLWGLHMGFTQGVLAAMVANATPVEIRGSAFGVFNFVTGLFMLFSGITAGWLWDSFGPEMSYYAGAGFSALALILLVLNKKLQIS